MPKTEEPRRKSIRLSGYDYSQEGAYFVIICTHHREMIFEDERFRQIVEKYWFGLPRHYPQAELDEFVVMPNHVHGIIVLSPPRRAGLAGLRPDEPAPTISNTKRHSLAEIVRFFKTYSAREINRLRKTPGVPVWQRNYWEHIIRSEKSLNKIREYIIANPLQWEFDLENPSLKTGVPDWKRGQTAEKGFWKDLIPDSKL